MAESGAQPGNQNARKGRIWSEALKRALARYSARSGDELPTVDAGLDRLADKMVKAADEGDKDAYQIIEKIGDRLEGKPAQTLIHNGDEEGGPVQVEGRIKLVRPSDEEGG